MNNNLPHVIDGNNNPFEIFNYLDKGGVRMTRDNYGNPWFCLNDICGILEIANPRNLVYRIERPYVHTVDIGVQTGIRHLPQLRQS